MNAFVITVSLLLLSHGSMSTSQEVQDDVTTPSNIVATLPAMKCATARGVAGVCMERQFCDYSTYAIDLTLYAPSGYKKPCADREVCCPFSYHLTTESKASWADKDLNSDENK